MTLHEIILENERTAKLQESKELILERLESLLETYPREVVQVLRKVGIPISGALPQSVVYSVLIKNLDSNSLLRESIARMLLEMDGYSSADGKGWQMAGGVITAVGSVLSGIGRSQTQESASESEANKQAELLQKQLDNERAQKQRQLWIAIGVSLVVIVTIIVVFKTMKKAPIDAKKSIVIPKLEVA